MVILHPFWSLKAAVPILCNCMENTYTQMLLVQSSNRCFLKCEFCEYGEQNTRNVKWMGSKLKLLEIRLTNFEVTAGWSALRAPNHTERHSVSAESWQEEAAQRWMCYLQQRGCMYSQREKQQPSYRSTAAVPSDLKDCLEEPPRFNTIPCLMIPEMDRLLEGTARQRKNPQEIKRQPKCLPRPMFMHL